VHLCIPMEYEADRHCTTPIWSDPRTVDGELLCPARYSEKELTDLKRSLGTYGVSGQLQQRPTPRGGGIIKRDSWQLWPPEDWPDVEIAFPQFEYIIASLDTAYTEKKENDFSACTVWGIFSLKGLPKVMLIDAWKERLEFPGLVNKVLETAYKRKIDALLIESKASGLSLIQELRRLCREEDFQIIPINPGTQDKIARVYSIQPIFEGGVVYAPDRQYSDMVISEFESFPKGKFDDLVDSSTMGLAFLRKTGMALLSREADLIQIEEQTFKPSQSNVAEMYGV
jgi:predicted phage terminase large subunit-like protein